MTRFLGAQRCRSCCFKGAFAIAAREPDRRLYWTGPKEKQLSTAAVRPPPHAVRLKPARDPVNDFSVVAATVNGSGSETANGTLLRALFKMGIPVTGKNRFPSNIVGDRKSTRLNSSHANISYAVFCLKKQ